jgi:hypothetical protein
MKILTILLLYTLLASLYDFRFRRVPNWITFPLLAAGLLANFPGTTLLWGATVFLVAIGFTKQSRVHSLLSPITNFLRIPDSPGYVLGMGDVKLWLACLWAVPQDLTLEALVAMALGWILMSLAHIAWQTLRHRPVSGTSPVAWASLVFSMTLFLFHMLPLPF